MRKSKPVQENRQGLLRYWRRLRTSHRRRRDLIIPAFLLVFRSIYAAVLVLTLRAPVHMRQYIVGALFTSTLCWLAVLLYIVLTPPSYSSHWTFILPTSSSVSSLQVESIGHAQTAPSSPFGNSTLSPKVIYKEIITSERVRQAAAQSLGLSLGAFGGPQVKLIDETALLLIDIRGRSPEMARAKAYALIDAFNAQLDALRSDEIRRRAEVVQESLQSYDVNLKASRERILEQQRESGVLSINQYNETATSMELMRRRMAEARSDLAKLVAEQERLTASLGLDPMSAGLLLQLSGDPAFYKLANDFAEANALYRQDAIRMGPANPILALSRNKSTAAFRELQSVVQLVSGTTPDKLDKLLSVINGSQRAELIKSLINNHGTIAGRREEIKSLEGDFRQLDADVKRMSTAVARLEDLKKDHLVAEAVFTSAFARLNTNKVDIYASYPMVQTLAPPDLPSSASTPYTILAILAGFIGSCMAAAAWGMAWLRQIFGNRRAKLVGRGVPRTA